MNSSSLVEYFASMEETKVVLASRRCLYSLDKFSACEACFAVCPVEAIQPGTPPNLNPEACQMCLACLPVCPMGAYVAGDGVESLLTCVARQQLKMGELICERNPNYEVGEPAVEGAIRVRGCLAGLGVGAYLALLSLGMEKVLVRMDACPECAWGSLQGQIEAQVKQAQHLLKLWNRSEALACVTSLSPDHLHQRPVWNADSPPISRRDLFRRIAHQEQMAVAQEIANQPGTEESGLSPARHRILMALKYLPSEPVDTDKISLEESGFAIVSVSAECTACGTCARICPTGALQFKADRSSFRLTFSPQKCINCGLCEHICTPKAVTINQAPTFTQVFASDAAYVVQQGALSYCKKCSTPFAAKPNVQLCPVCEFRVKNPFASGTPPGFLPPRKKESRLSLDDQSQI